MKDSMNDLSISLILGILRKNFLYFLITMFVFAAGTYGYCSYVAKPTYQAKSSLIATNGGIGDKLDNTASTIKSSDIAASISLINTYVGILQNDDVYSILAQNTNLGYSPTQLKNMVSVKMRSEEMLLIDVYVTSDNPQNSMVIANAFLDVGSKYVSDKMPNSYVRGIEKSSRSWKNYPNTARSTVLSALVAFILVFGISFIITITDNTIKGEEDFANSYDIPILGNIPNFKLAAKGEEGKK